jgi:hypothetical protein
MGTGCREGFVDRGRGSGVQWEGGGAVKVLLQLYKDIQFGCVGVYQLYISYSLS